MKTASRFGSLVLLFGLLFAAPSLRADVIETVTNCAGCQSNFVSGMFECNNNVWVDPYMTCVLRVDQTNPDRFDCTECMTVGARCENSGNGGGGGGNPKPSPFQCIEAPYMPGCDEDPCEENPFLAECG